MRIAGSAGITQPEHADVIVEKSPRIAENFQASIAYYRWGTSLEHGVYRATDSTDL